MKIKLLTAFMLLAALLGTGAANSQTAPQTAAKPADPAKILADVSGTYDFDIQGQAMVISFFVQDGKLFGQPENESAEQLLPMKGDNPLKFDVTVAANGQYYEIEFGRDEKGLVDKCTLRTQGMEVLGKKRVKAA
jgi:hypothetical protein